MYTSSCTWSLLYFLGQTLASALGSGCPVAPWNICLISQSPSLLAASLCRRFLHAAAAALALHLSIAADLPVPAASLNAKTTINGPSSHLRRCSLRRHSVSLRSPFALIQMLAPVPTSAGGQPLVRSCEDAASGAVWGPVSDSRTLKNVSHWLPVTDLLNRSSTLPSASSFLGELVPYVSNNDRTSG